ncbi:MAG: hypothetical protein ACTSQK_13060, partial [Candidatus Heimdallarchaeota archaeon]
YQYDFCKDFFSEKLRKHFEKTANEKLPKHYRHFTQAFGYSNKSFKLYFSLDIDPIKKAETSIIVKDISFESLVLKQTIALHPKEAFYIFANICANAYCKGILPLNRISLKKSFVQSIKRDVILSHNEEVSSFVLDYLEYLAKTISSGDLKPEFILRKSGARLLMALSYNKYVSAFITNIMSEVTSNTSLTKTKKIIYTTLLLLFSKQPKTRLPIKIFLKKNRLLIKEMVLDIEKPFPKASSAPKESELTPEEREKTNLPLFWYQGQPIEIYVLNNNLLGAITDAGSFDWGSAARPFQLLYELNEKTTIGKELSVELRNFLENIDFQNIKARSQLFEYLLGWNDPYSKIPYLDLELKNHPKKEDTMVLYNIIYRNAKLDFEIELTNFETFILLANIYISKFLDDFEGLILSEGKNWSLERFQEIGMIDRWGELSSEENAIIKENSEGKKQSQAFPWKSKKEHFSLLYLKYIRELLITKKITPLEILRLSGAPVLVILAPNFSLIYEFVKQILEELQKVEQLSFNRKIMYFTLLEMIDDKLNSKDFKDPVYLLVKEFYDEHYSIIHSLSNLLEKRFPY